MSNNLPAGPWAQPVPFVGGSGGTNWGSGGTGWLEGQRGLLVKRLDMWWDDERARGLRVIFSDDSASPIYGCVASHQSGITFNLKGTDDHPGPERIDSMWLAKSDKFERLGKMHIETNRGQHWEGGGASGKKGRVSLNVGSGLFVGMAGRNGWDIDAVAMLFLRSPLAKFSITQVEYTPDPSGTAAGLTPVTINEAHCVNPATAHEPVSWTFGGTDTRETTMAHEDTTTSSFGGNVSVEFEGKVFGVGAKAGGGFEWSSETSKTTSSSTTESVAFSWSLNGQLTPGEGVTCKAIVQRGQVDLRYTSSVTATLKDGTVCHYPENGMTKAVSYSAVRTTVESHN